MNSHEPFAARFDAIEINTAPSSAAFDHALAIAAPSAAAPELETPGFYLLNDAGGRFEVDRDFGVVSLRDETLAQSENGAVHNVRLKVIERSGSSYELDMQLRITGRIPQMMGADEFAFLANITIDKPIPEFTARASTAPAPAPVARPRHAVAWSSFSATSDEGPAAPVGLETSAFGSLLKAALPVDVIAAATLNEIEPTPRPARANADWSL